MAFKVPYPNLTSQFQRASTSGLWLPVGTQVDRNFKEIEVELNRKGGQWVGLTPATANSATTETTPLTVLTLSVFLLAGRRYEISTNIFIAASADQARANCEIRRTDVGPTQEQLRNPAAARAGDNIPIHMFDEANPTITQTYTYDVRIFRSGGGVGDTVQMIAASNFPSFLYAIDRGLQP